MGLTRTCMLRSGSSLHRHWPPMEEQEPTDQTRALQCTSVSGPPERKERAAQLLLSSRSRSISSPVPVFHRDHDAPAGCGSACGQLFWPLWVDASGSGFAVFDRLPGRGATMNTSWKKKGWRTGASTNDGYNERLLCSVVVTGASSG
jgi:hypothetical protein